MRIISFAWTTEALLAGKKTVTRRWWKKCPLKPGDLVQAYNKSPRFGGKRVAIIKIVSVREEPLFDITYDELNKEGGLWPTTYDFIDQFLKGHPRACKDDYVWRIEFELVSKETG